MRATSLLIVSAVVAVSTVGGVGATASSESRESTRATPAVATWHLDVPPPAGSATTSRVVVSPLPASDARIELPRARTGTQVHGELAGQPLGSPGADGQPEAGAEFEAAIAFDLGPDEGIAPVIMSPEGFQVVPGTAEAGSGPRVSYTVEVEPSVGIDPLSVAAAVEEALHDLRSWSNDATMHRVDDVHEAAIRVVLAEPATVDRLCREAGLDTGGRFSCWNGTFAALNAMRWEQGAADVDELTTYRRYLINHEVGHGLGYGHVDCGAPGELAPVMMQQTKGTGDCVANAWPYPELSPA